MKNVIVCKEISRNCIIFEWAYLRRKQVQFTKMVHLHIKSDFSILCSRVSWKYGKQYQWKREQRRPRSVQKQRHFLMSFKSLLALFTLASCFQAKAQRHPSRSQLTPLRINTSKTPGIIPKSTHIKLTIMSLPG